MVLPKRKPPKSTIVLLRGMIVKIIVALIIINFAMDTFDMFAIDGEGEEADERALLSAEDMFTSGGKVSEIDSFPGDRLTKKESRLIALHKEEKERKRRVKRLELEIPLEVDAPYKIADTSSWAKPSASYVIDTRDLWENEDLNLPAWMMNYFRWNKEFITGSDWETKSFELPPGHKFLYVTCLKDYNKCGGAADRLSTLPFYVKVAAESNRHILFQWTKPAALEEFLRPPVFGVDWRVPATKEKALQDVGYKAGTQDTILEAKDEIVLQVKFQSNDHGSKYYNYHRESDDEPKFKNVFHSVWDIFFTPSPGLALAIEQQMSIIGIVPGGYSAAHLRALYDSANRPDHVIATWARNAVNCAHYLQHRGEKPLPIYFASDSEVAVAQAGSYGRAVGLPVLSYQRDSSDTSNPLHLDKAENWEAKHPSDFYATFIDLYIMSMGVGVSHGVGGFGLFASLMSSNSTSVVKHMVAANQFACPVPPSKLRRRRGLDKYQFKKEQPLGEDEEPLFLPSMRDLHLDSAVHHHKRLIIGHSKDKPLETDYPDFSQSIPSTIWESSSRMPQWMKDYFAWHREQRELIQETNWLKFKYLIVTCFQETASCGEIEGRLRSIPFFVLVAAETSRVLLIKWERPAPLEDFLMPPKGGVDWRTPNYMVGELRNPTPTAKTEKQLLKLARGTERIVKSIVQDHKLGRKYYNRQAMSSGGRVGDPFQYEYRDCWYTIFTPVRPIVRMIEYQLETMNLAPRGFAASYLGARYTMEDVGRDPTMLTNFTRNSLNCLSNIQPGGPFLFLSDVEEAKSIAVEYGQERGVVVATRLNGVSYENLSLDLKGSERKSSDFYPIFVDLYLLSMAKCNGYNVGGLAKWAKQISGKSFDCEIRNWTPGVDKKVANRNGCSWTSAPKVTSATFSEGKFFVLPMAPMA